MSVLSSDLKFIFVVTLIGIITIFVLSSWHNDKIYQREKEERLQKQKGNTNTTNNKPKSSEVVDTLDWMLSRHIITPEEYTKLMGKCLPFL